jgi:hypothetical protein
MAGDIAGMAREYTCKPAADGIRCDDFSGIESWLFYRATYTRSYLWGLHAGGTGGAAIWIAYGTCTKF